MEINIEELRQDFERINSMMKEKGLFVEDKTKKEYFTGYSYKTLYDWDQYFEAIIQISLGWDTRLIENGVTIFLDNQLPNGFIQRSVPDTNGAQDTEHVKPFLAQIVMLVHDHNNDISWINDEYYDRLKKYINYWLIDKDYNKEGLSVWDSAPHTGMDNQHERAGYWYDCYCEGVDLNCFLVLECKAMAAIAKLRGNIEDEEYFTKWVEKKIAAVQTLWDEEEGLFFDRHSRIMEPLYVKYAGIFATLWAGVATIEQAERLVKEHLTNEEEFWRPFPIATLSADEEGYTENYMTGDLGCSWRANTWIPTNYYIFEGLRKYGYNDVAKELAIITYEKVKKLGDREYYTSESCQGCGLEPFWGWSLLAYIMPYKLTEESKDNKDSIE